MRKENGDIAKWKERTSIEIWRCYTILYKVDSLVNFDIYPFRFMLDMAFHYCQLFYGHKLLGFPDESANVFRRILLSCISLILSNFEIV